jgi:hypothetical protein
MHLASQDVDPQELLALRVPAWPLAQQPGRGRPCPHLWAAHVHGRIVIQRRLGAHHPKRVITDDAAARRSAGGTIQAGGPTRGSSVDRGRTPVIGALLLPYVSVCRPLLYLDLAAREVDEPIAATAGLAQAGRHPSAIPRPRDPSGGTSERRTHTPVLAFL